MSVFGINANTIIVNLQTFYARKLPLSSTISSKTFQTLYNVKQDAVTYSGTLRLRNIWAMRMWGVFFSVLTCWCWDGGGCTGPAAPLCSDADYVQHTRCKAPQGVRLWATWNHLLSLVAISRHINQSEGVQFGQGAFPLQHHGGLCRLGNS